MGYDHDHGRGGGGGPGTWNIYIYIIIYIYLSMILLTYINMDCSMCCLKKTTIHYIRLHWTICETTFDPHLCD